MKILLQMCTNSVYWVTSCRHDLDTFYVFCFDEFSWLSYAKAEHPDRFWSLSCLCSWWQCLLFLCAVARWAEALVETTRKGCFHWLSNSMAPNETDWTVLFTVLVERFLLRLVFIIISFCQFTFRLGTVLRHRDWNSAIELLVVYFISTFGRLVCEKWRQPMTPEYLTW